MDTERNYEIHDAELLVIMKSFCHYLEQPHHAMKVLTNYSNLRAFISMHKLTKR